MKEFLNNIQIQNLFLYRSIEHLLRTTTITAGTLLSVITESPIFPLTARDAVFKSVEYVPRHAGQSSR